MTWMDWFRVSTGLALDRTGLWWVVEHRRGFAEMLVFLNLLCPDDAIFYVEGTSIARDVQAFLAAHRAPHPARLVIGTLWPRPQAFHVPFSPETIVDLRVLAERHAQPELCDHFHVYRGETVLLEAHDLCDRHHRFDLSGLVPEERIKMFCAQVNGSYHRGTPCAG